MHSSFKKKKYKKAYRDGLRAEKWAALYLRLKGYRILEHRYQSPMGEIDLVALKKNVLIGVEVKSRTTMREALESITPYQQQRITRALSWYTRKLRAPHDLRFDVVLFSPMKWPQHIKNAWQIKGENW